MSNVIDFSKYQRNNLFKEQRIQAGLQMKAINIGALTDIADLLSDAVSTPFTVDAALPFRLAAEIMADDEDANALIHESSWAYINARPDGDLRTERDWRCSVTFESKVRSLLVPEFAIQGHRDFLTVEVSPFGDDDIPPPSDLDFSDWESTCYHWLVESHPEFATNAIGIGISLVRKLASTADLVEFGPDPDGSLKTTFRSKEGLKFEVKMSLLTFLLDDAALKFFEEKGLGGP